MAKQNRGRGNKAPTWEDPTILDRRDFVRASAVSLAGLAMVGTGRAQKAAPATITTNLEEIRAFPRTPASMPGRYPGRVVRVNTGDAAKDGEVDATRVHQALDRGLLRLTGTKDIAAAWRQFVSPGDVVGIKINPIGGRLLSTRPEVVQAIVAGLKAAGVAAGNIIIWDRRHFQMADAGFTAERFPGIRLEGTEVRGPNGEFYDADGRLWSRDNIDRDHPSYVAEIEGSYNKETLPYMINEGKHSYFSRLVTRTCTKIINVPVLKNAGQSVTLCLKNLSYGSLSNTGRLHKIWARSVAEPCAFPCLRDKVVLNIADGLRACYDGGPGANAAFIWEPNLLLMGTDPVAVDTVAYEFLLAERLKRKVISGERPGGKECMAIAAALGLGVDQRDRISLDEI